MSKQKAQDLSGREEGAMTRGRKKKQLADNVMPSQPSVEAQPSEQPMDRAVSPHFGSSSTRGRMPSSTALVDGRSIGDFLDAQDQATASREGTGLRRGVPMHLHPVASWWLNRRAGWIEEAQAPNSVNRRRVSWQRQEEALDINGAPCSSDSDE